MTFATDLAAFRPGSPEEAADRDRALALLAGPDPWDRSTAIHLTGSALVVHPPLNLPFAT